MVSLQTHLRWLRATAMVCAFAAFVRVEAPRAQSAESVPDSLGSPVALPTVPADSLGATPSDSLGLAGVDSLALPSMDVDGESEAPPRVAPWNPQAPVKRTDLDGLRPESIVEALSLLPGASVRVAGDRGMPAFVSLSPVDVGAPEIWVDGVPGRSPADFDASVFDHSAHPIARLSSSTAQPERAGGDPHLEIDRSGALVGRTLLDSHFSSTRRESFLRAVRVRTAAAQRELGVDFEEWKTDDGILFAPLPDGTSSGLSGRVKMRRFSLHGETDTDAGRLRFEFGRGRRLWPGSVLDDPRQERWTGQVSLGLDRENSTSRWRVRAWHLDWHDDDAAHESTQDAARLGIRIDRRPQGEVGWQAALWTERWSASFSALDTTISASPAQVTRARVGALGRAFEHWRGWAHAELAHSETSSDDIAVAGGGGLSRDLGRSQRIEIFALRQLRTPSLVETVGIDDFVTLVPTVDGFLRDTATVRRRRAAGELPFEQQDRVAVSLRGRWGSMAWQGGIERWLLREGIGWEALDENTVQTVGGLELDVDQWVGSVNGGWNLGDWRLQLFARGHRTIGALERDSSRGAGWPSYASKTRVGIDHSFFSVNNRLGLDVDFEVLGPRFDDVHAALGGAELETVTRLDLRARLTVRQTEMALSLDNVLDSEQEQVLGTWGRPRQLRWSLSWPFFN